MGIPVGWHWRHALGITGQLPENPEDALLVLQCVKELLDTIQSKSAAGDAERPTNVIPFAGTVN